MKTFKQLKEELEQIGHRLGSNPGGVYADSKTGEKHYVKHYKNPDQGKVEALTGKIMNHMGIKTLDPEIGHVDGNKHALVTKWNDKLEGMKPSDFHHLDTNQQNTIGKMYHAAILTKNWDIVGLEHDNISRHKDTGELHSVDAGGAFHFRAQGGPKEYGPDIAEKQSLRNNPGNASSQVFNHVFHQNPDAEKHGLEAVKNMDMDHIHSLFKNSGLSNHKELHKNFVERRNKLLGS